MNINRGRRCRRTKNRLLWLCTYCNYVSAGGCSVAFEDTGHRRDEVNHVYDQVNEGKGFRSYGVALTEWRVLDSWGRA